MAPARVRRDETTRPLLVHGERLREKIERVSGGGGSKFHPLTVEEARVALLPQAIALRDRVSQFPDELRGPRLIFQATLLPNYLAASYFPSQLLSSLDLIPIGSRSSRATYRTLTQEQPDFETKSILVAGTDESVERLTTLLESGGHVRSEKTAAEQFREFSEIRVSSAEEIVRQPALEVAATSTDQAVWEAVLHPGAASRGPDLQPLDDATFEKWIAFVESLGGQVVATYRRIVGALTFVPVRLDADRVGETVQFNPLRSIRPMPQIRPIPPTLFRMTPARLQPPPNTVPLTDIDVAVFDGGIDDASLLFPGCTLHDVTPEPVLPEGLLHGSAVTAAVLFGNLDANDTSAPQPAAQIDHYRVLPNPNPHADPDAYWVLDQIIDAVENGSYSIANLSLGPDISVEEDEEPNRWTSTLDQLAFEHDVLFVVAAGNNGEQDAATGLNRVQVPADMANGLSVGACDRHAPGTPWERAPYSALGPGRCGSRVQPFGVQFGGVDGHPFRGITADGSIVEASGTSFASPLVANSLIRVAQRLGKARTTPNNLRAFAVHFAERHADADALIAEIGHGRFLHDFADALVCQPNEVHLLYEDRIDRDDVVALRLPLPEGIDRGIVQISWTLALTAPTEPTQPSEYTQATLDLTFRPHDRKYRFTDGTRVRVVDVDDTAAVAALYADGYTASTYPMTVAMPGSFGTEEARREGGKWETVRHFARAFRASSLRNPRLDLAYVSREGGLLTRTPGPIDYTLLVTIRGREGLDLYDRARSQFSVITPLHVPTRLPVRT
jgi:hypothetical protein